MNDNLNRSGIYKITNIINNKIYIGSAVNFIKRKQYHIRMIKNKKHCNKHLEKSFLKYGLENFKFEIIEIVENKNLLLEREQFYLDLLKPQYNICKVAGSKAGFKVTDITKNKMSNIIKNNYRKTNGRIFQYSKNMELIKIWDCTLKEIANNLNCCNTTICMGLKNKNKTSRGYIWKYEKEVING
jgi:group I intron endonuclease